MSSQPWLEIKFGLRCYVPETLRQVWQFTWSVVQYWGALLTGGIVIAALQLWQWSGHAVWSTVDSCVALLTFFWAAFLSWRGQYVQRQALECQLAMNEQRPTINQLKQVPAVEFTEKATSD